MNQCVLDLQPTLQPPRRPPADAAQRLSPSTYSALCPITRRWFGAGGDDAPVLETLAGGLPAVLVSRAASRAREGCSYVAAAAQVRHLETGHGRTLGGLGLAPWRRWMLLLSFATPLTDLEAARLPLVLLPPPGVRPQHALQRLQAAISTQLGMPGWSLRLRAVADEIANASLRADFQLFVGALAPRLLELPASGSVSARRHAIEDLWLDATVRRRWQHVAVQLGASGAETLLRRAGPALHPADALSSAQAAAPARALLARVRGAARGSSDGTATAGRPPKNSALTIGASA